MGGTGQKRTEALRIYLAGYIDGEGCLAAFVLGNRNLVLFGKVDKVGTRFEGPIAPRGDHLDVRVEGIGREFEADLIIALAGCAVSDCVRPGFSGNFNKAL